MLLERKSMNVSEQLSHKIVDSFYAKIFQKDRIISQYSLINTLSLICENILRVRAKGMFSCLSTNSIQTFSVSFIR